MTNYQDKDEVLSKVIDKKVERLTADLKTVSLFNMLFVNVSMNQCSIGFRSHNYNYAWQIMCAFMHLTH